MSSITTIISHLVLLVDVKDNKPTGYSVNENVPVFDLLNSSLWVCGCVKPIGLIQQDEVKNQPQGNEGIEAFWIHGNRFVLYSKLLQR